MGRPLWLIYPHTPLCLWHLVDLSAASRPLELDDAQQKFWRLFCLLTITIVHYHYHYLCRDLTRTHDTSDATQVVISKCYLYVV